VADSAKAAGIKIGYLNASFAFGSTNVQPVALAMKAAGVDGATASVDPNTSYALITALRQAGVDLKAFLLPTGYGALFRPVPVPSGRRRTSTSSSPSNRSRCTRPPPSSSRTTS
jgi:ABC-type branched-subunit amino acid transport system substrate-binding protein